MYICTFKYTPEDVECQFCMLYRHRRCTAEAGCPYLAERIEAGVADYAEVIRDTFKAPSFILAARPRRLLNSYCGPGWEDEQHYRRFGRMLAEMGYGKGRNTPRFYAALFLLTANESIWRRAYNCFGRRGIEFRYFRYHGISIGDYARACAARSIACGADNFTLSDLEDREAVDDTTFRLVVSAVLIARYGMDVLKIGSESGAAYA